MNYLLNTETVLPQSFALQSTEPVGRASEAMPYEIGWFGRSKFVRVAGSFLAGVLLTGCAAANTSQSDTDSALASPPAGTTASAKPFEFSAQPSSTTTPNTTSASTTPSTIASAEQPVPTPASPFESIPRPEGSDKFKIAVIKDGVRSQDFIVEPQVVTPGTFFDLPEPPGCPWTERSQVDAALVSGDVPEGCDWSETSRWVSNAKYPTSPSEGKVNVGTHYCLKHIFCLGDELSVIPDGDADTTNDKYNATTKDQIGITVLDKNNIPVGEETYQICGVGSSPKYLQPGERSTIPTCEGSNGPQEPDLVVATCIYDTNETGQVSNRNTFTVARMISSRVLVPPQG